MFEIDQRDFLWEGGLERKDHLLRWEDVTKSKVNWGLGIKRLGIETGCFLGNGCRHFRVCLEIHHT